MSQHGINRGLVPLALAAKEAQNIWIEAQRDLLFPARPMDRLGEELTPELRNFRVVDFGIAQCVNAFPVRL